MYAKRMSLHRSKTLLVTLHGGSPYLVALAVDSVAAEVDASSQYGKQSYLAVRKPQLAGFPLQLGDDSRGIRLLAEHHGVVHVPRHAAHLQLAQDKPVHVGEIEVSVVLAYHRADADASVLPRLVSVDASLHQADGPLALILMSELLLEHTLEDGGIEVAKVRLDAVVQLGVSV